MIYVLIPIIIATCLIFYGMYKQKQCLCWIGWVIFVLMFFGIMNNTFYEIKEESPYYYYKDTFCEHHGMNYKGIRHWNSYEHICIKTENETIVKKWIEYDGERYAFASNREKEVNK